MLNIGSCTIVSQTTVISDFIYSVLVSSKCIEHTQSGNALPVNNPFLYQLLSEKSHYFKIFCPSFCRFISRLAFIFSPFSNMDLVMIPGGTGATASYNPISLYLCLANSTRLCKTMQFIQMLESWSLHQFINKWNVKVTHKFQHHTWKVLGSYIHMSCKTFLFNWTSACKCIAQK